jgi:NAD(P)-dependent dehydrogenase (short-subunit alcohol dehydrogenase family)
MTKRVVLITGCSSGIGLETALAFARTGETTVATMRNLSKADRLSKRATEDGLEIEVVRLDVTDDASVQAAVAQVESRHGAIDVVVNNAGVAYDGAIETIDLDRARNVMEANLWGPVRVVRAALPAMRARRTGVIVNVGSISGRVPGMAFQGFYAASKHGIGVLSEALAEELEQFGVRVVCIEPGFFATDIVANADDDQDSGPYRAEHEWVKSFFEKNMESASGDPANVGAAIVVAADEAVTPMHVVVGDDAVGFVALVDSLDSYETWKPLSEQVITGVAGPRPT